MTLTVHDTPFRNQSFGFGSFVLNGLHLAVRGMGKALPYEERIRFARAAGWNLIRFQGSFRRRIEANLRLVFPEMGHRERQALHRACAENIGQSLVELMSMDEFSERIGSLDITGPGLSALDPDRGVLFVTGHFGQWDAGRLAFQHLTGRECGIFFRPNNNGFYDRHWQDYISSAGRPILSKGGGGREKMVAHLSSAGALMILSDQATRSADRLDFLGQPARSPVSAAKLALEYDIPLIPVYGIRRETLTDYKVVFEAPIPHSDPVTMTQSVNNSLAARVRDNPEQYLWTHRRWR